MQYFRDHQLEIMFVLGCFCLLQALFCFIMNIKPKRKKIALIAVEIFTMVLLVADRFAYIYRGNTSQLGYYMVRISNFIVFAMNYFILYAFNNYIFCLIRQAGNDSKIVRVLTITGSLSFAGIFMLIISQFTGFYYTFDENNLYHRADGFVLCYSIPFLIMILQLCVIMTLRKQLRKRIFCSLILFSLVPLAASVAQIFFYGLSLTNITIGLFSIILYILAIVDQNQILLDAKQKEIDGLVKINNITKAQFKDTVLALATAIDAKDKYTHGHSRRVAEYSRKIAMMTGKDEKFCEEVYYAALLHDVGKIGIADSILTKEDRLTEQEFNAIQQHPDLGNQILKEISNIPYLSIGAHYHHEKFNGKGYPSGLKGKEIPEIARIIAVADAYDAMTSYRSYRSPVAQQKVREELVKGLGTQFDPEYATAMIHIMDKDTEYMLRDETHAFVGFMQEYAFDSYKENCTPGIMISGFITRISFDYESLSAQNDCVPSVVVYDSLDRHVYTDEVNQKKMDYTGFCDVSLLGSVIPGNIRDYKVNEYPNDSEENLDENHVLIEILRQHDHILIKMFFTDVIRECTIALMDRSQFAFAAITGKQCKIKNFEAHKLQTPIKDGYVKRIAEEISYIKGKEEGDLSNLEIAGWREAHSESILLDGKINISFHSMSLPSARRVWHCPIISIFTSDNGKVYGDGFREFALVRFDGESWEEDKAASNKMNFSFDSDFVSWDNWKKNNQAGVVCNISIERNGNQVILKAHDGGIHMENITTLSEDIPKLYCVLTGDQVAITAIHLQRQ